jgi:hypothetical protein
MTDAMIELKTPEELRAELVAEYEALTPEERAEYEKLP